MGPASRNILGDDWNMRARSLALTALVLLGAASAVEAQNTKIGYIDSQAILAQAPGAQEAQQQFEREMDRYRGELQRLGEELQRLISQYQAQERNLTAEAREARQTEIRRKEFEYEQRLEQIDVEAAQKRQELVAPILEAMSKAIEDLRTEGSYAIIFDAAAGAIIAADPELDLTPEILRRLRAAAGVGG